MARLVVRNGHVWDGTGTTAAPADVVIEAGRVVEVGPGLDGDEELDATGCGVLPGLTDCHVHMGSSTLDFLQRLQHPFSYRFFQFVGAARATLDLGITTVRDAAGADLGMKEAVAHGLVAGPRMHISITMLSQTGGHGDKWMPCGCTIPSYLPHPGMPSGICDGPDEVRRKVRELVRMGADVIKVATSGGVMSPRDDPRHAHFGPAELDVIVEEATRAHLGVMAHAQATDGIKAAVRAGVRSIEHGIWLDDEAIDLMLERGTWLVPTLLAPQGLIRAIEAGATMADAVKEKAYAVVGDHTESIRRAHQAGVPIAMGTDCPISPHGTNLDELALYVDVLGMGGAEALTTATSTAAALLGVADEQGTLEPGKRADLVVVDGDPLDVHGLAARVRTVVQDGRIVTQR